MKTSSSHVAESTSRFPSTESTGSAALVRRLRVSRKPGRHSRRGLSDRTAPAHECVDRESQEPRKVAASLKALGGRLITVVDKLDAAGAKNLASGSRLQRPMPRSATANNPTTPGHATCRKPRARTSPRDATQETHGRANIPPPHPLTRPHLFAKFTVSTTPKPKPQLHTREAKG